MGTAKRRRALRERTYMRVGSVRGYSGNLIATEGSVLDVSQGAICLELPRKALGEAYQSSLALHQIIGEEVSIFLSDFQLDLEGHVLTTRTSRRGYIKVILELSGHLPDYWIESFQDLIPGISGDFEDKD